MTDEVKTPEARRKLLRSLAITGGAAVTAKSLPQEWVKPAVDTVLLPAHSQTSIVFSEFFSATTTTEFTVRFCVKYRDGSPCYESSP